MDFRLRKQTLLERVEHVEEKASRMKDEQAQDLMSALAAFYREMAEELEAVSRPWTLPICHRRSINTRGAIARTRLWFVVEP